MKWYKRLRCRHVNQTATDNIIWFNLNFKMKKNIHKAQSVEYFNGFNKSVKDAEKTLKVTSIYQHKKNSFASEEII